MKRALIAAALGLSAVGLSGCLTLSPETLVAWMRPIELAELTEPAALEASARGGNGEAQYALSIQYSQGLGGRPVDHSQGDYWRAKATAARGYRTIPIYIAGEKGKPGYTSFVNTPIYVISPYQGERIERCIDALNGVPPRKPKGDPRDACGGVNNFERLAAAWPRR